jgi:hypothetical protein
LFKFVLLNKFFKIIGVINLSGFAVLGGGLKTTSLEHCDMVMTMKKEKTNKKYILILLAYILFYFFKVHSDISSFQDYDSLPHQVYNEQPLSERTTFLFSNCSDLPSLTKSLFIDKHINDQMTIWRSIFLSYNLRVHHLLKHQESFGIPSLTIISFLQKQNIYHKSSEDEELIWRFTIISQTKFYS